MVGFVIVVVTYWLWLRRQALSPSLNSEPDTWRYLVWILTGGLSVAIALPAAVQYAVAAQVHDFLFLRSILFQTAIYSTAVAVPVGLLTTTIIYARRNRGS